MIFLFFILNLICINAYSEADRFFASFPADTTIISYLDRLDPIHPDHLPIVMNGVLGQLSAYNVIYKNNVNDEKNENNENKIETLFLVKSYSSSSFSLMVLTKNEEYYMVTSEKTHYLDNLSNVSKTYKFLYYEMMDPSSTMKT